MQGSRAAATACASLIRPEKFPSQPAAHEGKSRGGFALLKFQLEIEREEPEGGIKDISGPQRGLLSLARKLLELKQSQQGKKKERGGLIGQKCEFGTYGKEGRRRTYEGSRS